MHIRLASAATALALLSTSALAADLPSRRAPPVYVPPPIPVFSWTGPYVGIQAGYAFGRSNATGINNATGGLFGAGSGSPDGVIGGAHIGYLYSTQGIPGFGGVLGSGGVIGVEGDVDGSNYRSNFALGTIGNTSRETIQGSIRGRLGIAVDRVLFYATGGAAFGGLHNTYYSGLGTDTFDHTKVGWTAGGGIEYAVTNNWSVRAEYRYTDFGNVTDTLTASTGPAVTVRRRETDNRIQAGISYKFDTLAIPPVVARY
jgi:outer membrane immunogenic protein